MPSEPPIPCEACSSIAQNLLQRPHLVARRLSRPAGLAGVRDLAVVDVRAYTIFRDRGRVRRKAVAIECWRIRVAVLLVVWTIALDGACVTSRIGARRDRHRCA